MAHTDRDDARWWWHDHFKWNKGDTKHEARNWYMGWGCWCETLPDAHKWIAPYRYERDIPSYWKKDQRKAERGKLRQQVQKARNGRIEWDDMPSGEGKMYRRPYYW